MTTDAPPRYWIGFDLGGTKMQCSLFDDQMQLVKTQRKRTRDDRSSVVSTERIVALIRKLLDEADVKPTQLAGIGIGCPGPVEWENGIVRVAVNLGWHNVAIGPFLEEQFECPVVVLNDVDAGVYGEYRAGAGRGSRTTVGIFPGTGIGGGCVYDGQILRGKLLSSMEIGHIKICDSPRVGATGMTGTLETEASRLAIAGEVAKLAFRGEAPSVRKSAGTDLDDIRSKTLSQAVIKGDTAVRRVIEDACQIIGYAVANVVLMICPDRVVLGGGLVEAMPELVLEAVSRIAHQHVFECYRDQFEIRVAELGDQAATVGAAHWFEKQCSGDWLAYRDRLGIGESDSGAG